MALRYLYRKAKSVLLSVLMVVTLLVLSTDQIMASDDLLFQTLDEGDQEVITEDAEGTAYDEEVAAITHASDEPISGDMPDSIDIYDSSEISVSQNDSISQNTPVFQNDAVSQNTTVSQNISDESLIMGGSDAEVDAFGGVMKTHEGLRIEGPAASYPYTGYPVTPEIHVYDGSYELVCGRDYKLTWKNNVNAGKKASVTITFIGNYFHTPRQKFFEITTEKIEDADISVVEGIVNGKVQKLAPVIRYNGVVLKRNTDYTLRYADCSGEGVPYKTAGTWKITVDGKGSFAGSSAEASEILHAPEDDRISISNKKVGIKLSAKSVAVSEEDPVPTITYMGSVLVADKDYTLEYVERSGTGKATIIIRGKGRFCDVRTVTYKVTKENLGTLNKNGRVRVTVNEGEPVVIAKGGARPSSVTVEVRADETSPWEFLTEGKDYKLAISNNKKAEKNGTVKVSGMGLYTGSTVAYFPIMKQSLEALEERLFVGNVDASAAKKDAYKKVKYQLYDLDSNLLKLNTDYTVGYEQLSDTVARITLTGKGNYTPASISREYKIITGKKSIQKAKIRYYENGKEVKAFAYTGEPVALDKTNIKLFIGKNEMPSDSYDIESCMNNVTKGKALITVRGTGGYSGLVTFKYQIGSKELQVMPLPGKKVMFIGDSRTIDMFSASASLYSGVVKDSITVYAKNGAGFGYCNNVLNTCDVDDFDIIVVWMGANDQGKFENYKAPYKKLLDKGKTLILCTAGPTNNANLIGEDTWRCSNSNMKAYNAALESWAKENNVDVIDLYSYISQNISIGGDGLHYTPQPTTRIWDKIIYELTQMKDRV